MNRAAREAILAATIGCLPALASATSSENYEVNAQQGSVAGASSSAQFRVESLLGTTLPATRSSGATYAVKTGLRADARFDRPSASLSASRAQAIVGQSLVLRAMIASAASLAGSARFAVDGATIGGCDAVPMQTLAGSTTGAGVATCTIDAASAGSHRYTAQFSQAGAGVPAQVALDLASTSTVATDYTDLWWGGLSQNGWGVSISQHGAMQFNVLYAYDAQGKPEWFVMPGGTWDTARTTFSGALYEPMSAPYDGYVASRLHMGAPVGDAAIRFTGTDGAQLDFTIDGTRDTKAIQRQAFWTDDGAPRLQVNDMWWAGEEQTGWGMNIAQQGRMLFITWFSYDANGNDTWFVVPGGSWSGTAFTGDLYATTSSPWLGASYAPAAFAPVKVGSMTLDFADAGWATMTYTVRGLTQSKTIVRQPY